MLLHGEEAGAWPVLEYALRTKQDTRIGFEDVLQRPDGWLATGNDDLSSAPRWPSGCERPAQDVGVPGRFRGTPKHLATI